VEERVPGCGGVYTAKQGTIAESSTANSEPGGVSCEYEIHLAVGEQVAIQFVRLDLEPQDCLEVLDVTDEGGSVLQEKICGSDAARSNPPAFTSQFNRLKIKFYARAGAFELNYRMACDFKLDADQGTITSPGYPNITKSDRLCTYTIRTAANTVISLKRIDFQLSGEDHDDESNCLTTNLRVRYPLPDIHFHISISRYPYPDIQISMSRYPYSYTYYLFYPISADKRWIKPPDLGTLLRQESTGGGLCQPDQLPAVPPDHGCGELGTWLQV